jgi:hypothetical protein
VKQRRKTKRILKGIADLPGCESKFGGELPEEVAKRGDCGLEKYEEKLSYILYLFSNVISMGPFEEMRNAYKGLIETDLLVETGIGRAIPKLILTKVCVIM